MFLQILKNHRGQGVAVEYAVLFFIVVAVVSGMTTYMKRAVQGRARDARNFMYIEVNGIYNVMHPDRALLSGYEPYYVKTKTDKSEDITTRQFDTAVTAANYIATYSTGINSRVETTTQSDVLSARHSNDIY